MKDLDWSNVVADGEAAADVAPVKQLTWRDNPWLEPHLRAEMGWTGGEYTRKKAQERVEEEFARNGGWRHGTCRNCGEQTWYRPTVGGFVCPGCRDVISTAKHNAWMQELGQLLEDAYDMQGIQMPPETLHRAMFGEKKTE